jgi:hypothetical protein
MLGKIRVSSVMLGLTIAVASIAAACGSDSGNDSGFGSDGVDASASDGAQGDGGNEVSFGNDGGISFDSSAGDGNTEAGQALDVEPSTLQTITLPVGQTMPTVTFDATYAGHPVSVGWGVDRGDLASVAAGPSASAIVTPTGTTGGLVTLTAGLNGQTLQRQILVKLTASQNGANSAAPGEAAQIPTSTTQLTAAGGVGGVGGEGLGPAVTDSATLTALSTPTDDGIAQNLTFLYPYNATVWPRGMLAPLLQWNWSIGDADAIQIQLSTTSGSFSWTGTFARPAILTTTGGKFIRMPIPQDIWMLATNSAGGPTSNTMPDQLSVNLVVAKAGVGYGPITETWTVAPGRLDGIIYYNSYGTQLAQNSTGAVGGNGMFGGAVLSIHVGDTGPQLVAGANGDASDCRVCHSVAANGSRLIVQHGDNNDATSSAYDLGITGATEHVLEYGATYPAVYPDGSKVLAEDGRFLSLPADPSQVTPSGLLTVTTDLGTPSFSPDGTLLAMNPMTSSSVVTTPSQQLFVMSYDNGSTTFSNPTLVVDDTGQPADVRPGWPAFLPDGKSLVFHQQSVAGLDTASGEMPTRKGCKATIQWTNTTNASSVTPLNQLNGFVSSGASYLPKLAAPINLTCTADGSSVGGIDPSHEDDANMNYEPTVNPIASGGYVWVVFTSRRMYGNVATIPPFCSDPRGVDLIENITPKKLWVAAIDLDATPGTDASHPAFYLPAQEILAGNSRGFWVLDPCLGNGSSCSSGDQCCNGYCEPGTVDGGAGDGGSTLVCGDMPPNAMCSPQGDHCAQSSDCCDSADSCVGGFCEVAAPP